MFCKVCKNDTVTNENEDCFEKALDVLKSHYMYYKNAVHHRDLELQQVKERNEKLNKALKLLQASQQLPKRFKSQNSGDLWLENAVSQEERLASEHSLTDDEHLAINKLNMALNSEELFDISSSSQVNNINRSSSEMVQSPRLKESPKRNKQYDTKRCLKDRSNTGLGTTKSEWHTKERSSPIEKSWALKFVHSPKITKDNKTKTTDASRKIMEKKLSLTLKKTNPSKIKQSILNFDKSKEPSYRESDVGEDMIEASPVITKKKFNAAHSWSHRSVQNSNSSCNNLTNETIKKDVTSNKSLDDDIVFDFSPSKKTDPLQSVGCPDRPKQSKCLKFNIDNSSDCTALPNDLNLAVSTTKSDSSSVVILTPGTEDIIFVEDDSFNVLSEVDTMDILADNLEKLKKYESKCIIKQPQNKNLETFKIPSVIAYKTNQLKIKHEKITQENLKDIKISDEEKPSCSKDSLTTNIPYHKNPLFSSEDDEDLMPQPFLIKEEPESAKSDKKLSIKQRFNIDCKDCEKLIEFLDKKLSDAEIQQHLDKCKRHNNNACLRRANTPLDFWNPFILSFQADDPRNEILIDNRFKESKK